MSKRLVSLVLVLIMALSMAVFGAHAEEDRVITILLGAQAVDLNDNIVASWLEEKTGFKVHYEYYTNQRNRFFL